MVVTVRNGRENVDRLERHRLRVAHRTSQLWHGLLSWAEDWTRYQSEKLLFFGLRHARVPLIRGAGLQRPARIRVS